MTVHGFSTDPTVYVRPDGVSFEVVRDLYYYGSQGDVWRVPAGFTTDFATIPAAVSWAIPKLGAYSSAAIVHDLLCEQLNAYHRWSVQGWAAGASRFEVPPPKPAANAVDTDAIFRKIAREYGVDPVTAALLWVGVRWGALANPARRQGWLKTAPAVLALTVLFAPVLLPATVLAVVGRGVLRAARRLFRSG